MSTSLATVIKSTSRGMSLTIIKTAKLTAFKFSQKNEPFAKNF